MKEKPINLFEISVDLLRRAMRENGINNGYKNIVADFLDKIDKQDENASVKRARSLIRLVRSGHKPLVAYCDASEDKSSRLIGIAVVFTVDEDIIEIHRMVLPSGGVIVGEYIAVLYALAAGIKFNARKIRIYSDFEVLIDTLNDTNKLPKNETIRRIYNRIKFNSGYYQRVDFRYIYREENLEANEEARRATADGNVYADADILEYELKKIGKIKDVDISFGHNKVKNKTRSFRLQDEQ